MPSTAPRKPKVSQSDVIAGTAQDQLCPTEDVAGYCRSVERAAHATMQPALLIRSQRKASASAMIVANDVGQYSIARPFKQSAPLCSISSYIGPLPLLLSLSENGMNRDETSTDIVTVDKFPSAVPVTNPSPSPTSSLSSLSNLSGSSTSVVNKTSVPLKNCKPCCAICGSDSSPCHDPKNWELAGIPPLSRCDSSPTQSCSVRYDFRRSTRLKSGRRLNGSTRLATILPHASPIAPSLQIPENTNVLSSLSFIASGNDEPIQECTMRELATIDVENGPKIGQIGSLIAKAKVVQDDFRSLARQWTRLIEEQMKRQQTSQEQAIINFGDWIGQAEGLNHALSRMIIRVDSRREQGLSLA